MSNKKVANNQHFHYAWITMTCPTCEGNIDVEIEKKTEGFGLCQTCQKTYKLSATIDILEFEDIE